MQDQHIESTWEWRIALYKSEQQQRQRKYFTHTFVEQSQGTSSCLECWQAQVRGEIGYGSSGLGCFTVGVKWVTAQPPQNKVTGTVSITFSCQTYVCWRWQLQRRIYRMNIESCSLQLIFFLPRPFKCQGGEINLGIAQWLERWTRDWKVAGSNPCWNGGRIFFSRVDFLCWLLFRYPFHPCVTTVACKRSPVILPKVQVAGYS